LWNTTVDEKTLAEIKSVNKILVFAQPKLKRDTFGDAAYLPDKYGFISDAGQVDELFTVLNSSQRNQLKKFLQHYKIEIQMNTPGCIRFVVHTSWNDDLFNSSWETMYLVFDNSCHCNCQYMPSDDGRPRIENIGNGWYKIIVTENRQFPRG